VAIAGDLAGGVESLIEHRASIGADSTCPPDLLRLSAGIEDVHDLWRDIRDIDEALSGSVLGRGGSPASQNRRNQTARSVQGSLSGVVSLCVS
jgi:hypothetical protein